jgi:spore coat polysaccharide biosynthesis protein SpsF
MAMGSATTPQVDFWRGGFGNSYTDRNVASPEQLQSRRALWADILSHTLPAPPRSILEVGANLGINLRALRALTSARFLAVEPNDKARGQLVDDGVVAAGDVRGGFASKIDLPDGAADLVFTSGVLIHIHPDQLEASIREIHRCASRWIAAIEYFSDKPEMIPYRGHDDRLFKRDFGGFWLDTFPGLLVTGYGFAWKRVTGLDNLTWWLFEKR